MNSVFLKQIVGGSAVLGLALSATAGPGPSGTSPAIDPTFSPPFSPPSGLNSSAGPTYPTPSGVGGVPVSTGLELFASGGPVYVTQLGPTGAAYDEQLFLASPTTYGDNNLFLDNHSTPNGTTYFLGNFAAGTEIEFGLDVLSTSQIWYDGPGSRNSDNDVHAYVVPNYQGLSDVTYVGFEDEDGSFADFNYTDEIYAFTGTIGSVNPPAVPDMAGTLSLLGIGLSGLTAFGRRFRK